MQDIENFQNALSKTTNRQLSKQDAGEAFHNLSGFMSLLIKINEREQVVPTRPAWKTPHADQ